MVQLRLAHQARDPPRQIRAIKNVGCPVSVKCRPNGPINTRCREKGRHSVVDESYFAVWLQDQIGVLGCGERTLHPCAHQITFFGGNHAFRDVGLRRNEVARHAPFAPHRIKRQFIPE